MTTSPDKLTKALDDAIKVLDGAETLLRTTNNPIDIKIARSFVVKGINILRAYKAVKSVDALASKTDTGKIG